MAADVSGAAPAGRAPLRSAAVRRAVPLTLLHVLLLTLPLPAAAACVRDSGAAKGRPAPPLRFGIGPLVQAGQVGAVPSPAVPERRARTNAALERLRPPGRPFVLRLNRFFWSDREKGFRRYLSLARRFARRGYLLELQVRYHPDPRQEGDIGAWRRHVQEVVRRFGRIRRVIALQITNEVNLTLSPDSSDGAYRGGRRALVEGVIAARDEVRRNGPQRLKIGFNWFWRLDAASERAFWRSLRDLGGRRFAGSVDWLGLDVYPGTVFPPSLGRGGARPAVVSALATLRCFAGRIGIGRRVPIKVEENGWPTLPPVRDYATQARLLEAMVRTVHRYRGRFRRDRLPLVQPARRRHLLAHALPALRPAGVRLRQKAGLRALPPTGS
jgi:hypothetical protein